MYKFGFYSFIYLFFLILHTRKRNAKRQQPANHQESRESNLPGVYTEEANRENYQELRDMRRSEIYDTV